MHVHWCDTRGLDIPMKGQIWVDGHQPHFWVCHRPGCSEGTDYICGIIADAIWSFGDKISRAKQKVKSLQ